MYILGNSVSCLLLLYCCSLAHNVHSILNKGSKWTGSYWLIDKARDCLGLSDLEKQNMAGGVLNVHIGDVLSSSVAIPGGYAGKYYIL